MARILIIDDNQDMRLVLAEVLRSTGHEIVLAAEGEEGINLHQMNPVDLVITDVFMPHQDGLETIAKFKQDFPQVPIIAMSGAAGAASHLLATAQQLGASGVLQKPFDLGQFLVAIKEVLAAHEANAAS